MSCAVGGIRLILFFFNFILTLCGLALLIPGIIYRIDLGEYEDIITSNVTVPTTPLIIIGAVIFIVAFFGCCGALRESHCMVTTYAVLLLTILVVEIVIGVITFYGTKNIDKDALRKPYEDSFNKYHEDQQFIDFVQKSLKCCGVNSSSDYSKLSGWNGTIPWSCCGQEDKHSCDDPKKIYNDGCMGKLVEFVSGIANWLGGIALGVAAVQFVGVIFALCLANSIKNAERRAYRV